MPSISTDSDATESLNSKQERQPGLFTGGYLWITIGSCALVFLGAFESLAVTTIMPVVSKDLDGANLYALAFAGPLATGVIGMVLAGNWSDRRGPVVPLYTSSVLFALGLLIAGTATTMPTLVAGRLVQGLGTGAVTVALYVIVARVFPPRLHPSIFAGFAAAWVIPSLIGPFAAGVVTDLLSWHWVFLGVVALVVAATAMVAPALRHLPERGGDLTIPWAKGRISWSILAAAAVLALSLVSEIEVVGLPLAALAAAVVLIAARPLLPKGTLLARRGLPSVILMRGLIGSAFFGAQVYLPYFLIDHYEFSPSLAGLALTVGSIAWSVASWMQGRMSTTLSNTACTTIGSILILVAIVTAALTAIFGFSPLPVIIAWVVGGGGMGLMFPRLSTLTLAYSAPEEQGFNSSALAISDSLGSAVSLALTGVIFALFASSGASFVAVFVFSAVIAVGAILAAHRVERPAEIAAEATELD